MTPKPSSATSSKNSPITATSGYLSWNRHSCLCAFAFAFAGAIVARVARFASAFENAARLSRWAPLPFTVAVVCCCFRRIRHLPRVSHGKAAGACLALFAALSLVAGIGLLRLRFWGWVTAFAYQVLGLVNMACLAFNPGATDRMTQTMVQYEVSHGMPAGLPGFPLPTIMWTSMLFAIVVGIAILWILFAYKKALGWATPAAI